MCVLLSTLQMQHSLSAFISYLDVLSNFLRSLWTLTLFSERLQSLPTWCHLSVINIPPSSKSWLKILQVSPQKVTLLIYHMLLHYLDHWRDESARLFQASFSAASENTDINWKLIPLVKVGCIQFNRNQLVKWINAMGRLFPSELCSWGQPATISHSQAQTTKAVGRTQQHNLIHPATWRQRLSK